MHVRLAIMFFLILLSAPTLAATQFTRDFAPTEDWIKPQEAPYRAAICLNGKWQFQPIPIPANFQREAGEPPELGPPSATAWEQTLIKIPSPWNVNAWGSGRDAGPGTGHPYWPSSIYYPSYPESWEKAEMGWLRRSFRVPADWKEKRIILHFEAVAGDCQVLVNGKIAGRHFDKYLPFELDITSLLNLTADNELLVGIRHHRLFDKSSPRYRRFHATYPPGSDTERLVGTWQDVYLLCLPTVRIDETFVHPLVDQDLLQVQITLRNDTDQPREVTVGGDVHPWTNLAGDTVETAPEPKWKLEDAVVSFTTQRVSIPAHERLVVTLSQKVQGKLKPWSPASPNLNAVVLSLSDGGQIADKHFIRFGWRQLKISGRDLLLNGQKIQMVGDICHPFGPFMMSRRFAWSWYHMIKDYGGNAVRPHAQPYPRLYLDLADEVGIMVLDETAIFGSSIRLNFEDALTWQRYADHYDALILRDRNHPSVFGWSFGNELFAIFQYNQIRGETADAYYRLLTDLGLRAQRLDPTRQWISCDGDEDLRGTLPIWNKHYGHNVPKLPIVDKPQMVGESGGTYYANPKQLAAFNGDRAYESYAGRNEALAIDLYQNVVKLARPNLTYFSPSEMVWFGLEHLPLGYKEFNRLPTTDDGIYFGEYQEGKPGMQLERIPPYVTTLNPGFDPELPLYKPLAMFEAMKAALAPEGPKPCPWDHIPAAKAPADVPAPTIDRALYAGPKDALLRQKLKTWGIPLAEAAETAQFLIVDYEKPPEDAATLRKQIDAVHARAGTILILVPQKPADLDAFNHLIPAPLQFTDRTATQLARRAPAPPDPRTASLTADDLYFAEVQPDCQILKCGLATPLPQGASILLEAANVDWSLFNRTPEFAKCSAVVLYEHHIKPEAAALVEIPVPPAGKGKTILSTIDFRPATEKHARLARALLTRLGLKLNEPEKGNP